MPEPMPPSEKPHGFREACNCTSAPPPSGVFVPCGIEQQAQRQDSTRAQLATVLDAARRLGCYDAYDLIMFEFFDKPALHSAHSASSTTEQERSL